MGKILNIKNKSVIVICLIVFSSCANRYKTLGEALPHLIYTDVVNWRYPNYYYDVPDTTIKLETCPYLKGKSLKQLSEYEEEQKIILSEESNESLLFLTNAYLANNLFNVGDTVSIEFGTYVFRAKISDKYAYGFAYHSGKSHFYKKEEKSLRYIQFEPNPIDTFAWGRFLEKDCYRFNLTTSGPSISSIGYKFIRISAREVEVTYCGGKGMNKYRVRL